MTSVPSLSTAFTAGQRFRATDVNTTNEAVNFANTAHVCRVYNDTYQTIGTGGSPTALVMPKELNDAYSWHSTSVNTSYITPTIAGWYLVTGNVQWTANATGTRRLDAAVNGVSVCTVEAPGASSIAIGQSVTTVIYANGSTDVFQLLAYQTSGGNLNTTVAANNSYFTVILLGAN